MEPTNMSHSHYAYPKQPDLEVIMRLAAVKRWHMIDTTRIQNLAEHTAIVSLLAWQIAHKCPGMYFPPLDCMLHAMVHDLAEAFTGDVPSHTKRLIGKPSINAVEEALLPSSFKLEESSQSVKDLIKLCDLAEGIRFIRLHGVDLTAGHAQEGLEEQYTRLEAKVLDEWPAIVHQHVSDTLYFFRYETERI